MEKELYLEINKEWFKKNADKLTEAHYERYHGETDDGDKWILDLGSEHGIFPQFELTDEKGFVEIHQDYDKSMDKVHFAVYAETDDETMAQIIANHIEDISGDGLLKVMEIIVKKLNKFKNAIESIRNI